MSGAIVVAILGAAWIVSHVMITLAGMVRADLHDLRESLERAACGEFARASPDPQRRPAGPAADGPGTSRQSSGLGLFRAVRLS